MGAEKSKPALNVLLLNQDGSEWRPRETDSALIALHCILRTGIDKWHAGTRDTLEGSIQWDAAIVWNPCGSASVALDIARRSIPCFALSPPLVFHPFHAAFIKEIEMRGGTVLPASTPAEIADSLDALRAKKQIWGKKLLVVNEHFGDEEGERLDRFKGRAEDRFGVSIVRRPAAELKVIARTFGTGTLDHELDRWYGEIFDGPGVMSQKYMRNAAALYMASREMLSESGACGIAIDGIGSFLSGPMRSTMPNLAYGPLMVDGVLTSEEGDAEILLTKLLFQYGLSTQALMSNIYLAYRDKFHTLRQDAGYEPELERADYEQCLADNHIVVSHFGTSGAIPPELMVEDKYRVQSLAPTWEGEAMVSSTPRLGPVVLGRINEQADCIHVETGIADATVFGEQYGWYRGKWTIKLPSVATFVENCQHHHYAIGQDHGKPGVFMTLTEKVFDVKVV
jgi:hypothetical protein